MEINISQGHLSESPTAVASTQKLQTFSVIMIIVIFPCDIRLQFLLQQKIENCNPTNELTESQSLIKKKGFTEETYTAKMTMLTNQ